MTGRVVAEHQGDVPVSSNRPLTRLQVSGRKTDVAFKEARESQKKIILRVKGKRVQVSVAGRRASSPLPHLL